MNGIIEITINGQKERLKFNNYAREELANYFIPEGEVSISQDKLNEAIVKKWNQNKVHLISVLVYAGHVGQAYLHDDTCKYSKADIKEYVADAPYDELMPIWLKFLEASGANLESETQEEESEPVKKKKKATSNS